MRANPISQSDFLKLERAYFAYVAADIEELGETARELQSVCFDLGWERGAGSEPASHWARRIIAVFRFDHRLQHAAPHVVTEVFTKVFDPLVRICGTCLQPIKPHALFGTSCDCSPKED